MPLVRSLWDNDTRLKLCVAIVKQMNFAPLQWGEICRQLGPAYSELHCKYGGLHCRAFRKLNCTRKEWKSMVRDVEAQSSSIIQASASDNSSGAKSDNFAPPTPTKQSGDNPPNARVEGNAAKVCESDQQGPHFSAQAKAPGPAQQSRRRTKAKKVAANTATNRKTRQDDQADDGCEDDAQLRGTKRQKTTDRDDGGKVESTNTNAVSKNAGTSPNHGSDVRPHHRVDSYHSYQGNPPPYRSGPPSHVIQPKSKANVHSFQDTRPGPQKPQGLDTRPQASGGRKPYRGRRQSGHQRDAGQHAGSQTSPKNVPRGPKNPCDNYNRPNQAYQPKTRGWSQAGCPTQASGG